MKHLIVLFSLLILAGCMSVDTYNDVYSYSRPVYTEPFVNPLIVSEVYNANYSYYGDYSFSYSCYCPHYYHFYRWTPCYSTHYRHEFNSHHFKDTPHKPIKIDRGFGGHRNVQPTKRIESKPVKQSNPVNKSSTNRRHK